RARQALPMSRQAARGVGAPHDGRGNVPRDGHALLVGADGGLRQQLRAGRSRREGYLMKIRVDEQIGALYLRLDDSQIVESREVVPGVVLDYDAHNQVVGIELLHL